MPSATDEESSVNLDKINPRTGNTIIVYNQRKVWDQFTNVVPTAANVKALFAAVDGAAL